MASAYKTRGTANGLSGSAFEKLDEDFDNFLDCMKPYVLNLSRKAEKQRIAMWIKKLCEPPGSSLSSRKNRNMYAQVLLAMLKRDLIEEPFSQQPEPGPLPTMPPYMSIYVDDLTIPKPRKDERDVSDTPSWIKEELESGSGNLSVGTDTSDRLSSSKRSPYQSHKVDYSTLNGKEDSQQLHLQINSTMRNSLSADENFELSQRQSPYQAKRKSGSRIRHEPVYLQEIINTDSGYPSSSPINRDYSGYALHSRGSLSSSVEQEEQLLKRLHKDREVEARTKLAEAKYHESKLKLQQQHDLSIQKILDRKNCELEEVKARFRSKITALETRVRKQDRRIVLQAREIDSLKDQRDKQMSEMKNIAQEKGMSIQTNFEKKLHDKIAEYEQEKFEMQKKHTRDIQEMLDETNERIKKMENENVQQVESLNGIVRNLEVESRKLSQECEGLQIDKIQLEQEKVELQTQLRSVESECDVLQESVTKAEKERKRLTQNHESNLELAHKNSTTNIELVKKEKEQALSKASDIIADLKNQITELQQTVKETEFQKQNEIKELISLHGQEKANLEHNYEKKIHSIEDELAKVTKKRDERISELQAALREKSNQLERSSELQRQQAEEAERALGDFRKQLEDNANKMFEDTKVQMDKVEQDLEKSKVAREKQAKEFTRQIENERIRHEKLVSELKISFEQEKTYLIREHQHERDVWTREHEREREMYSEKYRTKFQDLETQFRNKSSKDSKVIADLQQVNCTLREELIQKESLYKQQLVELGMLREEEKQTFKRQEEVQASKYRSELDQQRLQLQRQHSTEMEQLLDKTNFRFKQMEADYSSRSNKMHETVEALREEIQKLKDERINLQNSQEEHLNITIRKYEDEKISMKNHHSAVVKSLEKDIERQTATIARLEKQVRDIELRSQEKMSKMQFDYEEKIKGLLPVSIKEELEDTILSLRQQVSILQSRADLLQEEVDATNTITSTWDLSRFDKENIS